MQIPIKPFGGQDKSWASIPRINWGHPLARGLLFYGYDTGGAGVIDLVSGLKQDPALRSPIKSSIFGDGNAYTSGGNSAFFAIEPSINRSFVASRYSIACAWFITALPSIAFTCPFGFNDVSTNNAAALLWDSAATNDMVLNMANTNSAAFTANSINKFHSFVGTNTGAATQNIYFDGALKTTSALTSTFTTAVVGACFNSTAHGATPVGNGVAGLVYYGAYWTRTISAQEAFILHNDPYCFLIYPEDELFAMLVGTAAAPTTSEDQWHQPWSSVGRRYAIIAAG